jgi:hypothetical protein
MIALHKATAPLLCAVLWITASAFGARTTRPLDGVIDVHIHPAPDVVPRKIDAVDLARLAKERGMRAIVLKNHYQSTAPLAWAARKAVPGIEIFGGIALNLAVGGVNPEAVERMAAVEGGFGRVVWMPTFDAENQVRFSGQDRPFAPVSKDGALLPEVREVIAVVARRGLSLGTGHVSPEEALMIIEEARRQGVERIVVTHAMLSPARMTIPTMRRAAELGAFVEFSYNGLIGRNKESEASDYARAIREVGPRFCILSSDLGQPDNPPPPDGLADFLDALEKEGLTREDIDLMSKTNPARFLGLN